MVRLKEDYQDGTYQIFLFQFQYGTIKSKLFGKRTTRGEGFNSNMVRLKVRLTNGFEKTLFQFQYGTIKRPIWRIQFLKKGRFNSNMVRLKEVETNWHIGSWLRVSIPIWYD